LDTGFARLAVDAEVSEKAVASLHQWLADEALAAYRPQLERVIEAGCWDFLLDSFYRTIPCQTRR